MRFKPSNLILNLALTLGYLNPALNNWAQAYLHVICPRIIFSISSCLGVPGEPIPVSSEEEIFEIIGMEYKQPHERNL